MTSPAVSFAAITRLGRRELGELMARGEPPLAEALAGWEYRGVNMPATSALFGLRRFIKGFVAGPDGGTVGYNKGVRGTDLTAPWTPRLRADGLAAYAPFAVLPVDPTSIDNRYLNALLVDYSAAPTADRGLPRLLRDYLVRVVPGSDDLLLGHAFAALGRRRLSIGWFALERLGPVQEDPGDSAGLGG